jgi:AraC-like DNA-binding protein
MSKFHYIRRFRKIAGLTPNRFRIQNRIRKAQQMLRDGRPITEAALDVGFYDQSHFSKYFKRIVGVSPKEYISSLRNFLQ